MLSRRNLGATRRHAARGVTLVELVVAIALLGLLLGLAAPSFGTWTRNARVRTVSDGLQTGLRLAQAEATRRSRQMVFFLTNDKDCTLAGTASANGSYWAVRTIALTAGDVVEAVQCGVLADSSSGVAVNGPAAICFNSAGRQVANAATGVTGAVCTLGAVGTLNLYNVTAPNADRALRITVTLGGQVRMCDPARVLGAGSPDGCPI